MQLSAKIRAIKMRQHRKNDPKWRNNQNLKVKIWKKEHRDYCLKYARYFHAKRKYNVLSHYSGEKKPTCNCCSEHHIEFLSLDHINGGGNKQRKMGIRLYAWIIKNNFPPGFRVLCMNCNFAIGAYGYCPHKKEDKSATL